MGFRLLNRDSYSLYIWQEPFLLAFPFELLLTFAVAACSYHFLEKPVLALAKSIEASLPIIVISVHSDAERDGTEAILPSMGYSPRLLDGAICAWTDRDGHPDPPKR